MTPAVGMALIISGVVVAALQVRWAARAAVGPLRLGQLAQHLPARTQVCSNVVIVAVFAVGSLLIGAGQPWWVRWLAAAAAAAVSVAVQVLVLRTHRGIEHAGR